MKYIVVAFIALLVFLGGSIFLGYVNAVNYGVEAENQIRTMNKNSENSLSTYTLKIKEMAQVPDMYRDDLEKIIKATFEGRYGNDGSKAVVSFINEKNLPFDNKLYLNIQTEMVAGRNEFRQTQDRKLEVCKAYQNSLGYFWKGMFLGWAGYPKINVEDVCKIVSDVTTQESFKTGVGSAIKLR